MPMKVSLVLGPRRPLSRQTAWGCLTSNVALPGVGSLAAGRASGYAQLALAVGGLALTLVFGTRFILWYMANWDRVHAPEADPMEVLRQMWAVLRWAVLGIGIFAFSWLWGLVTGFGIVYSAKTAESAAVPPLLS